MALAAKRQEDNWKKWEQPCLDALQAAWAAQDAAKGKKDSAHDIAHIRRVQAAAVEIAAQEGGNLDIIMPAVWLHDLINVPKDHPDRSRASRFSADAAVEILRGIGYPEQDLDAVAHAIVAHSFSANIAPQTLEAKILQDSDRLDALGAIGVARCFATSGAMGRPLLDADDPLCSLRPADDELYAVDHFYVKLLRLPDTMQTQTGRDIAHSRATFMREFLNQLCFEQTGVKGVC